ncbi:FMN-dependent alpha-hydroxy acid dehydrogenase [Corynespora cassiicola Philippines]|uniref:FMN-dependent alpha-hydroxy acid dehydrogenase n=1 Tax=Corynespora cassiicola Philippines TaxID=1448308 RepID=A0A2T2NMS6_CORCC|nr:FMN-dependent alpha-hydroxy acid dehydrogenase [Corynespora cassiicola Philippines]
MRSSLFLSGLVASVAALEPFVNEPDTGLETLLQGLGNWTEGSLPALKDMRGIPDFEFAARQGLSNQQYSFYRTAAGGEWSYRNNLDIWSKARWRARFLTDVTKVADTLTTTVLGYNFSAPIFIAPAARGAYGDPERAEINFVEASGNEDTLYVAALYASKTIEELAAAKKNDTSNGPQAIFQQIYTNGNLSVTWDQVARAERTGAKAIVWTIDAPASSTRHRAARYDTTNANSVTSALTWDIYDQMKNHTTLPIIPKGITTVEDAQEAIKRGVKAIYISNHGGRQVDHSPSPLEIAYEIYRNDPSIFKKVDVLADSGVRYGNDVLKLLALGVKAVGLGRPFMFANVYGLEGVTKAIQILKTEIAADAAQIGIHDVQNIPARFLNTRALEENVYIAEETN